MAGKMTVMGVGTRVAPLAFLYLAAVIVLSYVFLPVFAWTRGSTVALIVIGAMLAAAGVFILLSSGLRVMKAFKETELLTDGFFRLFLNPMYASYVLFILPGLSLILNSWLVLTSSAVFYVLYRLFSRDEEAYLAQLHGKTYETYRKSVIFKFL